MLIFAVDDERAVLEESIRAIAEAVPDAEIKGFSRAAPALEAVRAKGLRPAAVFCDIEMPGMSGLEFAVELKRAAPDARIIFVTGYTQYAVDAFRIKAHGYLIKPLKAESVREELEFIPREPAEPRGRLRVQCFGFFEVYSQNRPLVFARTKSKELLAYLVDRTGAFCTSGEIISALWEDGDEGKDANHYLRVIGSELAKTLRAAGAEDVLIKRRGQWAVDVNLLDCDYYRMLDGDADALNSFHGRYMEQYSWAEFTTARLQFGIGSGKNNVLTKEF